jgi:glycosyltransferase involved in cell wall biosynthesis/2-polyprenyl-3-methyl-5-hydroxy-6-metoxy-1,4-benzoquinol methylase
MTQEPACWCGNSRLEKYSSDYQRCSACETLVLARMPAPDYLLVRDDSHDFYGRQYFTRMAQEHGLPPLQERTRTDFPERCTFWLRTLLKYKLPPGNILELGCAHGGFVALMRWAGFDSTGLDVSPWLSEFARATFDVPVLVGPVESHDIAAGSLDAVVLMDVLEHLGDPVATLSRCLTLLKPEGIFFLQTPQYREGKTQQEMEEDNDPFLRMLKPDQHLYLFSKSSLTLLLKRLGVMCVSFEPAVFGFYDMAAVAGRNALSTFSEDEVAKCLQSRADSRMALALLDLDAELRDVRASYLSCQEDSSVRLQSVLTLTKLLDQAQAERTAALSSLTAQLSAEKELLTRVRDSRLVWLLRKIGLWRWTDPPRPLPAPHPVDNPRPGRGLKRIVVDLTPVLPGGENGGAKVMTIELVRHLGRIAAECEFILLTSVKSHYELASLDSSNVRRICVDQARTLPKSAGKLSERLSQLLTRFISRSRLGRLAEIYRRLAIRMLPANGLLQELDADLLFCPFTAPFFFNPGVPVVSVVYDLQHVYCPHFFKPSEVEERNRNFDTACAASTRMVCISDFVRRTVLETGAITGDRVRTIPILLPRRLQTPSAEICERVLSSHCLDPRRYLLYPANFWAHKNHELLLTAFGIYRASNPSSYLKLVLTGSPGPRRDELIEASRAMGLSGDVVFPGYLANDDFSALMDQCTALIFPSLFEGFGMPLLEAMAAGRPILCANSTSLPEVAGNAALFFNPMKPVEIVDAISRIEKDSDLQRVLIKKGEQRLSTFGGPEEMAARYLQVFHEATNESVETPAVTLGVFEEDGWENS